MHTQPTFLSIINGVTFYKNDHDLNFHYLKLILFKDLSPTPHIFRIKKVVLYLSKKFQNLS